MRLFVNCHPDRNGRFSLSFAPREHRPWSGGTAAISILTQPRGMSAHRTSSIQSARGATEVSPLRERWVGECPPTKFRQPQRGGSFFHSTTHKLGPVIRKRKGKPKPSAACIATCPPWKARISMAHPCQTQSRKGRPPQRCLGCPTRQVTTAQLSESEKLSGLSG